MTTLREYKKQNAVMKQLGDMVKDLEYSDANTLEKPRKDLHRKILLPEMDKIMEGMDKELIDMERDLRKLGYKNPDDVDIDKVLDH